MSPRYVSPEQIAVKTATFALTPIAIFVIGFALFFEGRVSEAISWFGGDWRKPE